MIKRREKIQGENTFQHTSVLVLCTFFTSRSIIKQGQAIQKPVNANPGLKVDQSINISCIKICFTAFCVV